MITKDQETTLNATRRNEKAPGARRARWVVMSLARACIGLAVGCSATAEKAADPVSEGSVDDSSTELKTGYTALSAGVNHTCALRVEGAVECWGSNAYGQLTHRPGVFKQVVTGANHSCGLKTDGSVTCWGRNDKGQTAAPQGAFSLVTSGRDHTCALRVDGTAVCWGDDTDGRATAPAGPFQHLDAGDYHACGVRLDGSVTCWGNDTYGQSRALTGAFAKVAAGRRHTCAIRSDGTAACWGDDGLGQATPPSVSFTEISAGANHNCGLGVDGAIRCWGSNGAGQSAPPASKFLSVSAGTFYTCGIRVDGQPVCWGNNTFGEVQTPAGVLTTLSSGGSHLCALVGEGRPICWGSNAYQQATPPSAVFTKIASGGNHTCALRPDGAITCWGRNHLGQASPPAGTFTSVEAGRHHTCALGVDGVLKCWGDDTYGQTNVPAGLYTAVSAGIAHTCALRGDGTVACWGANDYGQAAAPAGLYTAVVAGERHACALRPDGVATCWGDPREGVTTPPPDSFKTITAGYRNACGVRLDGTIRCWGRDSEGQSRSTGRYAQLSGGSYFTCGIEQTSGGPVCWGDRYDTDRQLALRISPYSLPQATVGTAYDRLLAGAAGVPPHKFERVSGVLPDGLALVDGNHIRGVPTRGGTYTFTMRSTDARGYVGGETFSIVVKNPADPSTLTATTSGTSVTVSFKGMQGAASDWIVLSRVGSDDRTFARFQYTGGGATGTVTFADVGPGQYEARAYWDWAGTASYVVRGRSAAVTVEATGPLSITTNAPRYDFGAPIVITYANIPSDYANWVALATRGSAPSSYRLVRYTLGESSGSFTYPEDIQPGDYVLRVYAREDNRVLVESAPFEVVAPAGGPQLTVIDKDSLAQDDPIRIRYVGFPGSVTDSVCVAPKGAPDDAFGNCENTSGATAGTLTFDALAAGEYEARGYFNRTSGVPAPVRARVAFTIKP